MESKSARYQRTLLKLRENPYTWGKLVYIHQIGEYIIVEYKAIIFKDSSRVIPTQYEKESSFHPYIDGADTCRGFDNLDDALARCIAQKIDGHNTRADEYFMKSIRT